MQFEQFFEKMLRTVQKFFKYIVARLIILASPFLAVNTFANSDAQMLDILTSRGILTQEEATNIAKEMSSVPITYSEQSIWRVSVKLQFQHAYISSNLSKGTAPITSHDQNGFIPRRVITTFNADYENGWGAQLSFDFILPHNMSITYLYKNIDTNYVSGQFRMGYLKSNFCQEENQSPFQLYCTERSIATYYWGGPRNARRLGFGSFYTGCYWFGKSQTIEDLNYGFAVTNSENYQLAIPSLNGSGTDNTPTFWANTYYVAKFEDKSKLTFGLNTGYGDQANKNPAEATSIWGVNPYMRYEAKDYRCAAEFLISGVEDGGEVNGKYEDAIPYGLNAMGEYIFDVPVGRLGFALRYTYLNTDGRGVTAADGLRKCTTLQDTLGRNLVFKEAQGFYAGLNWYLKGNSLKLQLGYEFSQFWGSVDSSPSRRLDVNSIRSEIQILF